MALLCFPENICLENVKWLYWNKHRLWHNPGLLPNLFWRLRHPIGSLFEQSCLAEMQIQFLWVSGREQLSTRYRAHTCRPCICLTARKVSVTKTSGHKVGSYFVHQAPTYKGFGKKVVPRLREFCSCSCLPLLPGLACRILATWETPFCRAL